MPRSLRTVLPYFGMALALLRPSKAAAQNVTNPPDHRSSPYYEILGGIDLTSTTSGSPEQQLFFDTSLLKSMAHWNKDKTGYDRLFVWFTAKIGSVPTPTTASVSSQSSVSTSGIPGFNQIELGDITQSLEFHWGPEYAFRSPLHSDTSLALIADVGATTPFNAGTGSQVFDLQQQDSSGVAQNTNVVEQFNNNPLFANQFPALAGALCQEYGYQMPNPPQGTTCPAMAATMPSVLHVAFVPPNRSRFYREWAAGLRLRYFSPHSPISFPTTIDLKLGQDETVTAGHLSKFVLTVGGDAQIPKVPWLRVFGSAYLALAKNQNSPPLILPLAQTPVGVSDPTVVVQPIQPASQDYFRIGFGVDVFQIFKQIFLPRPATPCPPSTPCPPPTPPMPAP